MCMKPIKEYPLRHIAIIIFCALLTNVLLIKVIRENYSHS
jgi:hypothetical protein